MKNSKILSPFWVLAVALLAAGGPALAAEEDGGFTLNLKTLTLGTRYVDLDTDSAKFNEYGDVHDGFWLPKLAIAGNSADHGRTLTVTARNVGQRDARYGLLYDVAGSWSFELDYNKVPHRYQNSGTLLWQQTSPGVFEIADPVQQALEGAILAVPRASVTFPFLNALVEPYLAAARTVDVGIQRDRTHVAVELGKSSAVSWGLDYKRERRTGSRPFGAAFGFGNVNELPEPMDYEVNDATLGGEWGTKNGTLRFGARYSKFENNVDTLIWDNPFRYTDSTDGSAYQAPGTQSVAGARRGIIDLVPDNKSQGLFANGNWRFGKQAWLNFGVNVFDMKQNDSLVPLTLNTAIDTVDRGPASNPALLPQSTADREVRVTNATADFGTRFGDDWSLRLRYRYYDYDNKAEPIHFFGYVRYHGVWEDIPREAEPFAWTRDTLSAELGWDLARGTRLGLEYRLESMDRVHRDVESADDDVIRLTFDSHFAPPFTIRASAETGSRSTGAYEEDSSMPAGARRFDEAERDYDRYTASLDWNPGEAWQISFGVDTRKDEYEKSLFGLRDDEYVNYNANLSYAPNEKVSFFAFYQRQDRDLSMYSRQSGGTASTNPLDNWNVQFEEQNDLFGVGFSGAAGKVKYNVSGQWSKSDGFADLSATPGGLPLSGTRPAVAIDIPSYDDVELLTITAKVDYRVLENVGIGAFYRYDDYTLDSFLTNNLDDYIPAALLLAGERGDYQASVAGLYLRLTY